MIGSIYWQILDAVHQSVLTVVDNTVLRRKAQLLETDTFPIAIVSPGPRGEQIVNQTFDKGVWYDYPVFVVYLAQGNRQQTTGLQAFMDTREAIRNQLFQVSLLGGPSFDTHIDPDEAVKFGEYVGTNYDTTGFMVYFRVAEVRIS